jgi:hypothetical protein
MVGFPGICELGFDGLLLSEQLCLIMRAIQKVKVRQIDRVLGENIT